MVQVNSAKTNELIELIYESALNPSKWTDLLNALAEYVDQVETQPNSTSPEQSLLSAIPNLDSSENNRANTSISETLKSITKINEESHFPEINQANDLLIGHFARALKIAKRLVDIDEQHNIVLSLLDRMPIALILVDSQAKVVETNTLADELILSEIGISINSKIFDVGNNNNARFLDVVSQMSKHDSSITQGQSLSITFPEAKNDMMFFIAPLRQQDSQKNASVAVFISQRKSLPVSLPKDFSETYNLTNKELEITQLLIRGLSVKEISEEKSVSTHTVRSQVKSVMHKTNTSRQAELVSLVYNGMGDFVNSIRDSEPGKRSSILNKSKYLLQDYKVFQLSDGRNLAYAEYGNPEGEPLFHCHSVLGSRLELAFDAQHISQQKSVRLIVIDRPGYGASDPYLKTNFTNWVKDLTQLADHLNIGQFSVTGYAMGGIYALACAHEIPKRLKQVAIIGTGMRPESASDYETIIPLYKMNNRLARHIPKVYCLLTAVTVKGILSEPATFFKQFNDYLDPADQGIMNSERFKTEMFASLIEGFRQDGKAAAKDVVQLMQDWCFNLANINIPIHIWHGSSDYHIPLVLAKRFTEHIKETKLSVKEGEGHYLFYTHWQEILDSLFPVENEIRNGMVESN